MLDQKLADLVAKGLISNERMASLKQELLGQGSTSGAESKASPHAETKQPDRDGDVRQASGKQVGSGTQSTETSSSSTQQPSEVEKASGDESQDAETVTGNAETRTKRPRRPQSMEESMRAYGLDPDAIAKIGQKREPTDVNQFVAAALQAAQAEKTARDRKSEDLEDQEELLKEAQQKDDEVEVDLDDDASVEGANTRPELGRVLPKQVKGKLAGVFDRLGQSLDPEASSLLSQLLDDSAGESSDSESGEEDDGTTEDLAGLLASLGAERSGSLTPDLDMEEFRREQKEREERMEKAAAERKVEMERRQAERDKKHEEFEAEQKEREEQRKKDRAEFEENRRKHAEYMAKVEERKKKAEARRAEMEEMRSDREDRMAEALKMAHQHMKDLGIKDTSREEL